MQVSVVTTLYNSLFLPGLCSPQLVSVHNGSVNIHRGAASAILLCLENSLRSIQFDPS